MESSAENTSQQSHALGQQKAALIAPLPFSAGDAKRYRAGTKLGVSCGVKVPVG
jgi:hypothetical protein